jgi:hypothetical protein
MKSFKTEEEVREHFKNEVFEFEILCDGVADYNTLVPTLVDGSYQTFKVSFFVEDKPFARYDNLDGLLGDLQIFEVYAYDAMTKEESHWLYQNKYEENYKRK